MKGLAFDLETSPRLGWYWGNNLYEQSILKEEQSTRIMGIGWSWLHLEGVEWVGQPDFGAYNRDKFNDTGVVKTGWKLLDEADFVIAHNGRSFDVKQLNMRFVLLGLPPPSPYKILDTKTIAKRYFRFPSNKLDNLSQELFNDHKLAHTGKELWFDCMRGDEAAWKLMADYCKQDVVLLKKLYKRMLPWIDGHPNWNSHEDNQPNMCPNCGGGSMEERGWLHTATGKKKRLRCRRDTCGRWFTVGPTFRTTDVK